MFREQIIVFLLCSYHRLTRKECSSAHLLTLLADAKSHAFGLCAKANQALDANGWRLACCSRRLLRLLNRHVDETIFLELALGIEVGDQEASLLISFRNLRHQLDIKYASEVLYVLFELLDGRVNLHLVLPIVVSPFLLEL